MKSTTLLMWDDPQKVLGLRDMGPWSSDTLYPTLRNIFDQFFISTSWPIFTKFQFDLAKTHNMKVVDLDSSFPKYPRTQNYQVGSSKIEKFNKSQNWKFSKHLEKFKCFVPKKP